MVDTSLSFLSVETSATGRRWLARPYDERVAEALAQRHALTDILSKSMAARGVGLEDAPDFLQPTLRALLPDPSRFRDMDVAADRFAEAVQHGESMAVFGDYDVDGGTSSALLLRFARALGVPLRLYVPDRMKEGYGPNAAAMERLAHEGVRLVVCVDCGVAAHAPLAAARAAGLDVIVLDHHAADAALPPAVAIVNPNRLDEAPEITARYGMLAAIGVTFLFVVAVNRALRQSGFYTGGRAEPDIRAWLDIVALGTVCDVVRLTGLNRAFVAQGLKVMGQRRNPGLVALAAAAGHKGEMDTYAAGFILGPRVNAGGRVGRSDLGARLLATDDAGEAMALAAELESLNAERRALEADVLAEADAMTVAGDAPLIFTAGENWHAGVIGIVASRLKEKYHRPAIVVALDGAQGKGSGRSVAGLDLGTAVIAARQAGLLVHGGGHRMAAGLTVERDKIDALRDFLTERIARQVQAEPLVPTLMLDGLVAAPAVDGTLLDTMAALAPFGTGNPEPRFAIAGCRLVRASIVGENHVSVIASQGGGTVRAIAFRAMDSALGPALLAARDNATLIHLAGHIRRDSWQGQDRAQMILDDAAPG